MGGPEELDGKTVDDALQTLQELVRWELTPRQWQRVSELLEHLAAALAARDARDVGRTTTELTLYGSRRILRVGGVERTGVPEPVAERRNTLVHALVVEHGRGTTRTGRRESDHGPEPTR